MSLSSALPTRPELRRELPSLAELVSRASALRPLLRERAQQTERDRRVSVDVTRQLTDAGLFRVLKPKRFGGFEMGLEDLRQLAFVIGQGCASTGWCYGLSAANAWIVGMFPAEAQADVWDAAPDNLIAASIAPTGKITAVPGGLQVRGRWSFTSNCDNAQWLALGGMLETGEGQPPKPMFVLVPESDYRIIDNWHTVGLAGTGSKDIAIDAEVFVPIHRSVSFAEVLNQDAPGAKVNLNPLYRVPFLSGFPALLANPALASLRGALDEFADTVGERATRGAFAGGGSSIANFSQVQTAVAEAEAALDAAHLILARDLRVATETAAEGLILTQQQRIEFRRGHAYSVRLCVSAIDNLYAVVGGAGLQLDNVVQRAWRDVNAVAHHISVNWHAVSTMVGQMRLGLPPRGQF